jgi:hypothetical protein
MIERGEKLLQKNKDDRTRNDRARRKAIATKKMKTTKRGEKLLQKKKWRQPNDERSCCKNKMGRTKRRTSCCKETRIEMKTNKP